MNKDESKKDKSIPCPICGKTIKSKAGLGPHKRYAHEGKSLGVVPAKPITIEEAEPVPELIPRPIKEEAEPVPELLPKTTKEGAVEEKPLKSWEEMGVTDYQQFLNRGITIGVDTKQPGLAALVADHVFGGGDYKDMDWVWQALNEMAIRPDYKDRWFNTWRSYCHRGTPGSIAKDVRAGDAEVKKEGSPELTHRLDEDDKPVYCGGGLGDLTYKDALELSKIRSSRRPESPGKQAVSEMDLVTKAISAVKDLSGMGSKQKSYLVMPGEDGQMIVQEHEEGRPIVINPHQEKKEEKQEEKKTTTYIVDADGNIQTSEGGAPVVIKQPATPQDQPQKSFLIDQATGKVTEVDPRQPVIIKVESQPQGQATPLQVMGPDGKPLILDLTTLVSYNKAMGDERRAEESHKLKQETFGVVKDLFVKLGRAAGKAGGD